MRTERRRAPLTRNGFSPSQSHSPSPPDDRTLRVSTHARCPPTSTLMPPTLHRDRGPNDEAHTPHTSRRARPSCRAPHAHAPHAYHMPPRGIRWPTHIAHRSHHAHACQVRRRRSSPDEINERRDAHAPPRRAHRAHAHTPMIHGRCWPTHDSRMKVSHIVHACSGGEGALSRGAAAGRSLQETPCQCCRDCRC